MPKPHPKAPGALAAAPEACDAWLGRAAVRALFAELALEHKPGLVSFRDSGSHSDMDARTFVRSIQALRSYFPRIAQAGREGQPFDGLKQLGVQAEQRMLAATGGVNTHRGAIFLLGLLCAAAGRLHAAARPATAAALRERLRSQWGRDLIEHAALVARQGPGARRGQRRLGVAGAAEEAAQGLPTLFDHVLPALRHARRSGRSPEAASVQALFVAMSLLADTNVIQRGGDSGLEVVRNSAQRFLQAGGVADPEWRREVQALHAAFVARRLSSGGSADLLAAALWVDAVTRPEPATLGLDAEIAG